MLRLPHAAELRVGPLRAAYTDAIPVEVYQMRTWFYDNKMQRIAGHPTFIQVERVYCLSADDFTEADDQHLNDILRELTR